MPKKPVKKAVKKPASKVAKKTAKKAIAKKPVKKVAKKAPAKKVAAKKAPAKAVKKVSGRPFPSKTTLTVDEKSQTVSVKTIVAPASTPVVEERRRVSLVIPAPSNSLGLKHELGVTEVGFDRVWDVSRKEFREGLGVGLDNGV